MEPIEGFAWAGLGFAATFVALEVAWQEGRLRRKQRLVAMS